MLIPSLRLRLGEVPGEPVDLLLLFRLERVPLHHVCVYLFCRLGRVEVGEELFFSKDKDPDAGVPYLNHHLQHDSGRHWDRLQYNVSRISWPRLG